MDSTIIAAIIAAIATIVAALIATRADLLRQRFARSAAPRLRGTWKSIWWTNNPDGSRIEHTELFHIERQKGNHIAGRITSSEWHEFPCDLEGIYNDRFLQIIWLPSPETRAKGIRDYGCYFLVHQADGSFRGYAMGFYYGQADLDLCEHVITRIKE